MFFFLERERERDWVTWHNFEIFWKGQNMVMIMVKIKKKVGLTKTIMSISTTNYEIIMISLKIISTQIIKKKKNNH